MEGFTITITPISGIPVVSLSGYLNEEGGVQLHQKMDELLRSGQVRLVIDVAACKAMNSPGVASMMNLVMKVNDDFQGGVIFVGLDRLKTQVFKMVGIIGLSRQVPTIAEALAILA